MIKYVMQSLMLISISILFLIGNLSVVNADSMIYEERQPSLQINNEINDIEINLKKGFEQGDSKVNKDILAKENYDESVYYSETRKKINELKNEKLEQFALQVALRIKIDGLKYRGNEESIRNVWAAVILSDFTFKADSVVWKMLDQETISSSITIQDNISERLIEGHSNHSDKPPRLKGYYIDNNSDTTVIVSAGYRGYWTDVHIEREAAVFTEIGYNVLLTDPRGMGQSEGQYIGFGDLESKDLRLWIDNELRQRPEQDIIIYGASMGGATTLSYLANGHVSQNVKLVISDSSYASIENQLRYVYRLIASMTDGTEIDKILGINAKNEDAIIDLVKKEEQKYLGFDIERNLPLLGVSKSNLPLLLIHGSNDDFVPLENIEILKNNSNSEIVESLVVDAAEHAQGLITNPELYFQTVKEFSQKKTERIRLRFIDETTGNEIQQSKYAFGYVGQPLNISEYILEGYEITQLDELFFTTEIQTFDINYRKKINLKVSYFDMNGNLIAPHKTFTGLEGEKYDVEVLSITNHRFIHSSMPLRGEFGCENIEIKLYYDKQPIEEDSKKEDLNEEERPKKDNQVFPSQNIDNKNNNNKEGKALPKTGNSGLSNHASLLLSLGLILKKFSVK